MERPIGEKFLTPEGVELEVVEAITIDSCIGCYYNDKNCNKLEISNILGRCWGRIDNHIIFKQTK